MSSFVTYSRFVTRVARRMLLVLELFTLPEHLRSHLFHWGSCWSIFSLSVQCFLDHCLCFRHFTFTQCIVLSTEVGARCCISCGVCFCFFVSLFLLVFVLFCFFFMGGREDWVYRTSWSPTFLFIDVLVPSNGSGRYLCV